jgi:hypothetical protein
MEPISTVRPWKLCTVASRTTGRREHSTGLRGTYMDDAGGTDGNLRTRAYAMDGFTPIKGKCTWWRETLDAEERHNRSIKPEDVTVRCVCFVEGHYWSHRRADVPEDCPECRRCRYYIKHM